MSKVKENASALIDQYIEDKTNEFSRPIVEKIRKVIKDSGIGIQEDFKWGGPNFFYEGPLCMLGAFKQHVAVAFFQGALIDDTYRVLKNAQEKTKAMRQLRYESLEEVNEKVLVDYLLQAANNNKNGNKIKFKKEKKPIEIPHYFLNSLKENPNAEKHFHSMSYSHQKEYIEWVTEAKRESTKLSRTAKAMEMLNRGEGKNDKYRNC